MGLGAASFHRARSRREGLIGPLLGPWTPIVTVFSNGIKNDDRLITRSCRSRRNRYKGKQQSPRSRSCCHRRRSRTSRSCRHTNDMTE